MADKHLMREKCAASVMQCRLNWPEAERYAAALEKAGVLESGDEVLATAILSEHVPHRRALNLIEDLKMYAWFGGPAWIDGGHRG